MHLRISMQFEGILVLRVVEASTNGNRVQFIGADSPVQHFLAPNLRIEDPFPFGVYDRNRQLKSVVSHCHDNTLGIVLIGSQVHLFLCLRGKPGRDLLVGDRIFRANQILAVRSQDFAQSRDVERFRRLNQGVSSLLGCRKFLLLGLRCCSRIRFLFCRRQREGHNPANRDY